MKIIKIETRTQHYFKALYECEACNHRCESSELSDEAFLRNEVTHWPCPDCGELSDFVLRDAKTPHPLLRWIRKRATEMKIHNKLKEPSQ